MKTIAEYFGNIQQVFNFDFDYRLIFDDNPTEEHLSIIHLFRIISAEDFHFESNNNKGRPAKSRHAIFKSFLIKSYLRIQTTRDLILRLKGGVNIRKLCGYRTIKDLPSESVFSRAFRDFADLDICKIIHDKMIKDNVNSILIGHISRDSTTISARETPINKKKDVEKTQEKPKRKRGRPKKGEVVKQKEPTMIEKQVKMCPFKALEELNLNAAWGCKKNSQNKVSYWKGYKLHLDVTDFGLPVTAVITGANVYDNQLAIPMEKITSQKIDWCYSVMDAGYDAEIIKQEIKDQGRIPIIDSNKRRGEKIDFCPAKKQRYKIRSVVERSNGHLKDWLFAPVYVRGYKKVKTHLMFGVILLTAIKILQYIKKFDPLDKAA